MSNFICSECGMTNIDCGGAGYKTPKEIELEKKLEIATKALKRIDPPNINFEDYNDRAIALWEIAHNALKEIGGVK